jgi:hypothetical protein
VKYRLSKEIVSLSAINDYHGLGKAAAMRLEAGESVEIKKPPKGFIDNGYLIEAKNKGDE